MSKSKAKPDDLILLVERIVAVTEAEGEEKLTIPTHTARALLEMAKRAPRSRAGRPSVPGRVKVQDSLTVHRARARKRKLLAKAKVEGRKLTAGKAALQAAEEESLRSRLSAAEIFGLINRRSRR